MRGLGCAAFGLALAGCGDGILLTVDGDRAVPAQLDGFCLAVADRDPAGGQFGRAYRIEHLPDTLAVEPGHASSAEAWVRGYRGGAEVADDRATTDFGDDVTLRLDRCASGPDGAPRASAAVGPADAAIAVSIGRGGNLVVAVGGGAASIVDVDAGGALVARDLTAAPAGAIGVIALDVDGDCDDDLVVWTASEARLLRRDVDDFTDLGAIAGFTVRAAAVADVDRDGDQDLVLGGGATLRLYRAGDGGLAEDATALPDGAASDVTALALGDVDGDGNPDLIVGQGSGPPLAFTDDASGSGSFAPAPAIVPAVDLAVRGLALGDADGDGDLDLAVAVDGAPARLYINRDGRLEDQSFVRLPQPAPTADGVALADWNGDCLPDLALASPDGAVLYDGAADGTFTSPSSASAASAAAFVDLDDDGARDLVLATSGGITWLHR